MSPNRLLQGSTAGKESVSAAKESIGKFFKTYHESVKETRSNYADINNLFFKFETFLGSVKNVEKSDQTIEKDLLKIGQIDQEVRNDTSEILNQVNRCTVETERIIRMLTRQNIGLNQCEQLVHANEKYIEDALQRANSASTITPPRKDHPAVSKANLMKGEITKYNLELGRNLSTIENTIETLDQVIETLPPYRRDGLQEKRTSNESTQQPDSGAKGHAIDSDAKSSHTRTS